MHQESAMSDDKSLQKTPGSKPLSTSLKERLKKCGRYHSSPLAVSASKRPCVSSNYPAECEQQGSSRLSCNSEMLSSDSHADSTIFSPHVTNSSTVKYSFSTPDLTSCSNKLHHIGTPVLRSNSSNRGLRSRPSRLQFTNQNNSKSKFNKQNQNSAYRSKLSCEDSTSTGFATDDTESTGQTFKTNDRNDGNVMENVVEKLTESTNMCKNELELSLCKLPDSDCAALIEERNRLKMLLQKKEEELRKLNMVKMYRKKNDLNHLSSLIRKWTDVSQQALTDLLGKMPDPKPTLTQLIDHLHIDHGLVKFDAEEETFN